MRRAERVIDIYVAERRELLCKCRIVLFFLGVKTKVFENPEFAQGTFAIARAVAEANAFSIVGGGDSAAAVAQSGMESKITHISTGGGASLEFLSGQKLPGVEVLTNKS